MITPHSANRSLVAIALVLVCSSTSSAQNTLQITSPADGTVVTPGQVISVVVAPSAGSSFPSGIGILGDVPLGGAGPALTPPFSFSLTIPPSITPGRYTITAVARDALINLSCPRQSAFKWRRPSRLLSCGYNRRT
jgi:hypothetical protein